ncbi:MAG: phage portal protein, partial [Gammaproteobacteria bacterium]|nr:phage portal protein [Gammaproteobacteria bacterium]
MNFKNRLTHLKSAITGGKKLLMVSGMMDLEPDSLLEWALTGGGRISASQAMAFYRNDAAVATAVDMIVDAIEQIKPVLLKSEGKDKEYDSNHPAVTDLLDPNPFETYREFIGKMARHYLLTHAGYYLMFGNMTRPPLQMWAPKPQNVSVMASTDNYPNAFMLTGKEIGRGTYDRIEDIRKGTLSYLDGTFRELYRVMGFSSRGDDSEPDSPLEAAATDIRQHIQGKYHNLALLENGGRLSLIFTFKDKMNDDAHKERKKRIQEQLVGSKKGGIAVISAKDVDITEAGKSNKDMDYATLDSSSKESIYLRYKIPLPLVTTDASSYNNIEQAIFDFYENTVLPNFNTILSGISKVHLPRYKLDPKVYQLTYDPESIAVVMRKKLEEIEKR